MDETNLCPSASRNSSNIPKILDGKYFQLTSEDYGGKLSAKCTHCTNNKCTVSGCITSTGNFIRHYKNKHPGLYDTLRQYLKFAKPKSNAPPASKKMKLAEKQTKLFSSMSACNVNLTQEEFEELIINYIIEEMRPLCTVEKPSFKNLLIGLVGKSNIHVPCRLTIVKRIEYKKQVIMKKIIDKLEKVEFVCSTADIWSCHNRSFMGMTVHFINPNTLVRENYVLACRRFKYIHSYDKIAELISAVHNQFNLLPDKITHTVTDNATNFGKAFRVFHKIALTGDNDEKNFDFHSDDEINDSDDDIQNKGADADTNYFDVDVPENILNLNESDTGIEEDIILPKHMNCLSHSLNLLATTDANKALESNIKYKKCYQSSFSKAKSLWNTVSRSTKSADICSDICGSKFTIPVITRWNSTYDAVKKIIKEKHKINDVFEKLGLKTFKPSDISFLEEYINVLEPVAVALDTLQGENGCFLGYVLPSLYSIKKKLNSMIHLNFCEPLKLALLNGIQKRFADIMDVENTKSKDFVLATVSVPRFKLNWLTACSSEYEKCKALFILEYSFIKANKVGYKESESETSDSSDFFSCLTETADTDKDKTVKQNPNLAEAISYLENKTKILDLINSNEIIKHIFLKYNTTLPSSAPVERLFSSGSQILVPRRCNLSDRRFESLLFLKGNIQSERNLNNL